MGADDGWRWWDKGVVGGQSVLDEVGVIKMMCM